ncbi:MAG TPA: hypothetical protein VFJ82_13190 [Longimicrobium sp.]|nr:hypothetical protein [Longimicrobium sp.]
MRFARLKLAALAVVAAGLVAGGCGDSATMAGEPNLGAGSGTVTYALKTINDAPLPVDMRNDASGRVSITKGEIVLSGGTDFRQNFTISETPAGATASIRESVTEGTFTVRGTAIIFHASTGGEWEGTMSGNEIWYNVPGNTGLVHFSFQRG